MCVTKRILEVVEFFNHNRDFNLWLFQTSSNNMAQRIFLKRCGNLFSKGGNPFD